MIQVGDQADRSDDVVVGALEDDFPRAVEWYPTYGCRREPHRTRFVLSLFLQRLGGVRVGSDGPRYQLAGDPPQDGWLEKAVDRPRERFVEEFRTPTRVGESEDEVERVKETQTAGEQCSIWCVCLCVWVTLVIA